MKIAYFDCFSGISGDMTVGALIDLGFSPDILKDELRKVPIEGYEIYVVKEKRMEIAGTRFNVNINSKDLPFRSFSEIRKLFESSSLSSAIKEKCLEIFHSLATVEGRVHMLDPEEVHFHEVGAIDSIVDIVGVVIGIESLGIEEIHASAVPLGSGFVETRHGPLPIPAPATIALLDGIPTFGTGIKAELVTPTGAAIVRALAKSYGPPPLMKIISVGYGVGRKNLTERPNLLRIILGEKENFEN